MLATKGITICLALYNSKRKLTGMKHTRGIARIVLLASLVSSTVPASSQQPSREREALRRSQQQAAKLQQDNAALQREKTETEAKLKSAEVELGKLKAQASKLKKATTSLEAAEKDNADLKSKLAATEEHLRDSSQKSREQLAALRHGLTLAQQSPVESKLPSEQDAGKLRDSIERETGRAAACEAKNQQLYSVTMDLIARYKANREPGRSFSCPNLSRDLSRRKSTICWKNSRTERLMPA
jgi:chromosome segregation ATPase